MNLTESMDTWRGRAEKAEAELERVQAQCVHWQCQLADFMSLMSDESIPQHISEELLRRFAVGLKGYVRKEELEHAHLERDHYKNKVERCREILGAQANESICEAAERVQAQCAEMRKVLTFVDHLCCCEDPDWTDLDGDMVRHSLSSSAGTGYVRADDMTPALEGAFVICRCFADGQEASPGFMDNNENVLRIKDALARAKRFLA